MFKEINFEFIFMSVNNNNVYLLKQFQSTNRKDWIKSSPDFNALIELVNTMQVIVN